MGNRIICIGREFGSGGHEVAVSLGKRIGIKVYEKHLLYLACQYGEMTVKTLESSDEKATNPYLFQTVHEGNHHVMQGFPTSEVLFQLQSHEIRRIAKKENCIFVGRCADFVLLDTDASILSVFVSAPEEWRIERVMKRENLSRQKARRLIHKMDQQRRKYYEHYTGAKWGDARHYEIYVDRSVVSIEEAVDLIAEQYKAME